MGRNLVALVDGTWCRRDSAKPSNIALLDDVISRGPDPDGVRTEVAYFDGVGTNWQRFTGGILGVGVTRTVKEVYKWFCEQYQEGDRLYLIGFSRGAFIARSVAGCIGYSGLTLPHRYELGFKAYRKRDKYMLEEGNAQPLPVPIECLMVFDTVGSRGVPTGSLSRWVPRKYEFHDLKCGEHVKYAHHYVALDEQRIDFPPTLWDNERKGRVVQEWFSGWHGDVGGGNKGKLHLTTLFEAARVLAECGLSMRSTLSRLTALRNDMADPVPVKGWFWRLRGFRRRPVPHGATVRRVLDHDLN